MDYKGLKDRHLNIFCVYGVDHLENNITKAFINTLDSLNPSNQAKIYSVLLNAFINSENLKSTFYLQQRPDKELIESVLIQHRYVVGISPTGKCWGYSYEDTQDEEKLKVEITNQWRLEHQESSDEEIEDVALNVVKEIRERRSNKGSIPDAWIFISNLDSKYLIIIENKLYNLDPDQINNHIEKSLLQVNKEDKNEPKYFTFKQISEMISRSNTFLADQFVEYLTILGYLNLDSLPLACSADKDIRERLAVHAGTIIMNDIFKSGVDRRSRSTVRKHLNKNSYLREINLCFGSCTSEESIIYLSLALGPTMSSAKWMFNNISLPVSFNDKHINKPFSSFHLQYNRGKNISKSYIRNWSWEVSDYIEYWKNHQSNLRLMTTEEAASFIEALSFDGKFPLEQANDLSTYLKSRKNPINIVPEIVYEISWTCEEISKMKDNAEFVASLKNALTEFLNSINYSIEGFN